ncbi:MAG: hypothetical protein LBS81_05290 [Endomicrobium sp.]|jgi:apolipoprotein N-acyltransferase|nr:hypothetical protein [Endomicrobium sp.]
MAGNCLTGYIPGDTQLYSKAKRIINTAGGFNIIGSLYNDENNKLFNVVLAFESNGGYTGAHKKKSSYSFWRIYSL